MIQKISNQNFRGNGPIKVLYPGLSVSETDTGIGSIGRVDHAEIHGNTLIKMHPHMNDEIVSYFRTGKAEHNDSEGIVKMIGKHTLMYMKAGKLFHHEEKIFGEEEPLEGLQIFIRPGKKDLKPEVHFVELENLHSENEWRLLGSPTDETKFQFSSQTWLYDMRLSGNHSMSLPVLESKDLTFLLYVFQGSTIVNNEIHLDKKDSLLIKNENITITTNKDAELVLFVTDEKGEIFKEGMFSGNQAVQ